MIVVPAIKAGNVVIAIVISLVGAVGASILAVVDATPVAVAVIGVLHAVTLWWLNSRQAKRDLEAKKERESSENRIQENAQRVDHHNSLINELQEERQALSEALAVAQALARDLDAEVRAARQQAFTYERLLNRYRIGFEVLEAQMKAAGIAPTWTPEDEG